MPLAEAVAVARQIADALDAAHEHGVVHRDLKPSNIKLRADGTVKVLDFGLAKAIDPASSAADLTQSPTLVSPAVTQAGFILGTAAYMSPEQAKGRQIDKRSDIWAFGCVLYEMLTGVRAYEGDDVTDTMAAILRGEPDWTRVPANVPPALVRVLKRCMEKDRRQRRHDIGDVRMDIDDAMSAGAGQDSGGSGGRWSARSGIAVGAMVIAAAGIAGAIGWYARPDAPTAVRRFVIPLAQNENYSNIGRHVVALSPDGAHLVYVANFRLNMRHMDQLTSTVIPGTEATGSAARGPFFSPDGQWIGYWADGQMKRVSVTGGAPVALATTPNPLGASWSADDTILYAAGSEGIWRVPGSGGTPEQVIKLASGEMAHGPQLLPDGEHVLFTLRSAAAASWDEAAIVAQSLRTGERKVILKGGRDARYVDTGHLLYATKGTLLAIRFDAGTLEAAGGAVSLVENVADAGSGSGTSQFAISQNGTLAYVNGAVAQRGVLVWVDRTGREDRSPASAEIAGLENPRLSPDGSRVALISEGNVWVQDLQGRPPIKLTFDGSHYSPVWSRDGSRIFFEGSNEVMVVAADASSRPEQASPHGHLHPYATAPDGEVVVVRLPDGSVSKSTDILRLAPGSHAELKPVVATENMEGFDGFSLSPDGRWLAYASQATGRNEIWVQPYPGPGGAVRVSPNGGVEPMWARDGSELFYLEGRRMMVVAVHRGTTFAFSPAEFLFESAHTQESQPPTYDVAADGRFLSIKRSGPQVAAPPIVLTLDWFEELKRRLP